MSENDFGFNRRGFLRFATAGAFGLVVTGNNASGAAGKPLRGIFPIAQTPFTESNKLDLDVMAEQVRFIHRGGVHGFVWPQMASEWGALTEKERLAGAETIASVGTKLSRYDGGRLIRRPLRANVGPVARRQAWRSHGHARGVFKTYAIRGGWDKGFASAAALAAGGEVDRPSASISEGGKRALRETLDHLKPYLRA